jgi:hypothetical protein
MQVTHVGGIATEGLVSATSLLNERHTTLANDRGCLLYPHNCRGDALCSNCQLTGAT